MTFYFIHITCLLDIVIGIAARNYFLVIWGRGLRTNSFSIGESFGISGVCCLDRFLNKGAPFCGHCALLSKNVFCFIYFFPKINVTFPFVMNFGLFDFGPSVHCITFWKTFLKVEVTCQLSLITKKLSWIGNKSPGLLHYLTL